MKVIVFDIETAPILGYSWGMYKQNILSIVRPSFLMCFAYKELGSGRTHTRTLRDYPRYEKNKFDDKPLVEALWKVLDEADVLVAHNGDAFDIKMANAFFIKHGMKPPSPYETVDTLKEARKVFRFDSNKLASIGELLQEGSKIKHSGFSLWIDCMNGHAPSWDLMEKYCKQDVVLLENVYTRLLPYMKKHPNRNTYSATATCSCPKCGSDHVIRKGFRMTTLSRYARYLCKECGGWFKGEKENDPSTIYRL